MSAESGAGIPNFNGEVLSRSFVLAEKFKRSGSLGEKPDQNERDIADENAREILDTSFVVKNAEGQINNVEYTSVEHMIELSQSNSLTDDARERTRQALYEVGLALSQDNAVFKAATEGTEELEKLLPPSLHKIQPYILSSYLTDGKDDTEGQELVGEMVDLFRLKRKADRSKYFVDDYNNKAKELSGKLMDICDYASAEDVNSGRVGRMEQMMGFIVGIDDKTGRKPVLTTKDDDSYYPDNKKDKKDDDEDGRESSTRAWEIDPEHMADALKFMAGDLRWSDWTPPEWFKRLEKVDPEQAYRISVMAMMNEAAAGVAYAGKNLDKIIGNDTVFAFTHEHMSKLFNEDFKLVTSKMLNDLCELYPDQNGRFCLRYKERYYEVADNGTRDENQINQLKNEGMVDAFGFLLDKRGGERVTMDDIPTNRGLGVRTIERGVFEKIQHIKRYEDELAMFLAESNGRKEPNYMDRMNAYTAWNMFYGFGDSSMADRMRILPTFNNVISDALRTLNPEYKALAKWQILKSGKYKVDTDLFDAEYFSGSLADYVLTIMKTERDLKSPIDGKKTLREKILSGEMPLLANKTFYGFYDFVHGARDLYKDDFISAEDQLAGKGKLENFGKKADVTLASLVMNYGEYGSDGKFVKKDTSKQFNFGNEQVTFMNEFRDMLEAAILTYNCTTGKTEVKDPAVWARTLKDKLGMVNGIEINGTKALSYTSDPELWRDAIIGTFGADMERLSSSYIRMAMEIPKGSTAAPAYNLYVNKFLTITLKLSNADINLNEVMRKLGVSLGNGESAEGVATTFRNKTEWVVDGMKTRILLNKQTDKSDRDLSIRSNEIQTIMNSFSQINQANLNSQTLLIYRNLGRAIGSNNEEVIKRLWKELSKNI